MDYIKINDSDNVCVALNALKAGEKITIGNESVVTNSDIPAGHKVALKDIGAGEDIIKYGNRIGLAKEDIKAGDHVHTHNIKTALGDLLEYKYVPKIKEIKETAHESFMGFRRANGKVGVRNEIWIIPTVGCVNNIAQAIERRAKSLVRGSVEDIIAFVHPYGCSQMGDDQENTRKTLIEELINNIADEKREEIDASELIIGMKCGGSDGLSGITANPIVGEFSDILISKGGSTILTEVPEMFGAETLLMERCKDRETFEKTVALINDFKMYFKNHNQTIYENPSPGNKAGGISTLEDKSLGCTQKSGSAKVVDVLGYGETLKTKGLNLLSSPGNDLVAATALAMSGAHIVLFTTGRGTPFASPVPTLKIATNSRLAKAKGNWIDFNAGRMIEDKSKDELANDLFKLVLEVASGKKVKSEIAGFHDFAIFKQGVTL